MKRDSTWKLAQMNPQDWCQKVAIHPSEYAPPSQTLLHHYQHQINTPPLATPLLPFYHLQHTYTLHPAILPTPTMFIHYPPTIHHFIFQSYPIQNPPIKPCPLKHPPLHPPIMSRVGRKEVNVAASSSFLYTTGMKLLGSVPASSCAVSTFRSNASTEPMLNQRVVWGVDRGRGGLGGGGKEEMVGERLVSEGQ